MFGSYLGMRPVRMLSGLLAVMLVLGALVALSGCGDNGGNITPPPATIIRAADSPTVDATPDAKGQATATPAKPQVTPPSSDYPAESGGPYPDSASAYPSPTK
jgi:hypothetical protein